MQTMTFNYYLIIDKQEKLKILFLIKVLHTVDMFVRSRC